MARDPRPRGSARLNSFRDDVIAGLSRPQKSLSPKYFYDARGSRLFEAICRLKEYYPTRAELALTRAHLGAIARFAGAGNSAGVTLIEYGSGESVKSSLLIKALRPAAYVPIDISAHALRRAFDRRVAPLGVTRAQWRALAWLARQPGLRVSHCRRCGAGVD